MRPRHPGVAALLILCGASPRALANEPVVSAPKPGAAGTTTPGTPIAPASPPTPAKLGEARLHFQQGVALYKEQNYDAALAEFLGAYAISGEPIVTYNVGLTYKALFRYSEAMETLERYLDESAARGHPVSKDRRAEVENIIAEMRSLLADVTVSLKPAEAALRIDGRLVPLSIEGLVRLPAGSHVLDASAPDYVAAKREITVVAGTPQTVSLALAAIPRTGKVTITASQIGAHVIVDGRDFGAAPAVVELAVGGHQVEVSAPGYAPSRSELSVAAGQSRTVTIFLEPPRVESPGQPFYHRWWFWTGVGVAAAAVVTAIVLQPQRTQAPLDGTLGPPANTTP
jgi:hypothetical protein